MSTRTFSLMLLVMLFSTALVFGGGRQESGIRASGLTEVSIAHWDITDSITGAPDPVYDRIKEVVGISIDPVAVSWGDYRDKLTVWAASGELPNAFSIDIIGSQIFRNWVESGVIQPLPADMSAYPNLNAILSASDVQPFMVDNQHYFLPRPTYSDPSWWANDRGILIRTDWMENLGFDMPQTAEEVMELLVAFATQDPDGNGLNDTVGLTVHFPSFLPGAFNELSPFEPASGWLLQDGRWVHGAVADQTFELYTFLRELYQRGGIDPDFAVLREEQGINKFGSGRAGAIAMQVGAKHWARPGAVWSSINPDIPFADVTGILRTRPDSDGNYWRFTTTSFWSESYISASTTEEQRDAIFKLYDYMLSEEFRTIIQWGFEGVDYRQTANGPVSLLGTNSDGSAITPQDKYPFLSGWMSSLASWGDELQYVFAGYPEGIRDESYEELVWRVENTIAPDVPWLLNAYAPNLPSFQRVNLEPNVDMVNFILSDLPPAQAWQQIIDTYNAQGYQQLEEEMNQYAQSIGM